MGVIYSPTVKAARMQALEIGTVGFGSVLAVIELAVPSFNRAAHVLTMLGVPRSDISADASGTAAVARIKNGECNYHQWAHCRHVGQRHQL
jgi:hypothetical protein